MSGADNDRQFCWEQIQRGNRLFRLTHVFAAGDVAGRLLPLYALFASLEHICASVSDEDVAVRKLDWWRQAMRSGDGDHPVIAELRRNGASALMPEMAVTRLLDATQARLDMAPPPGSSELTALCIDFGRIQLELELAVSGVTMPAGEELSGLALRSGMMQVLRESMGRPDGRGFWWLPLDLMARYDLARAEIASGDGIGKFRMVAGEIFTTQSVGTTQYSDILKDISNNKQSVMNLIAMDALFAKKLKHTNYSSYIKWRDELSRAGFSDVFTARNAVRRFNRRK